jgi:hypothetical protein
MDNDALVLEADLRFLRICEARRSRRAAEAIAPIGTVEELVVERALQRLGRDFDLDCMRRDG